MRRWSKELQSKDKQEIFAKFEVKYPGGKEVAELRSANILLFGLAILFEDLYHSVLSFELQLLDPLSV